MFKVKEMRSLALSLPKERFDQELGPFVLIQRPPPEVLAQHGGLPGPPAATLPRINMDAVSKGTLGLLFEFDDLMVATLPPLNEGEDTLTVGRLPDCDLVIEEPSVSKQHAVLKWLGAESRCLIADVGSTNGTYLNASVQVRQGHELDLRDGDIVSFGEVQFWFLLTPTLWQRLSTQSGANKLGSRSG